MYLHSLLRFTCNYTGSYKVQSSRWAPILRPKTSKKKFRSVNLSVFIYIQTKYCKKFRRHYRLRQMQNKNLIWTSKFKFSFGRLQSYIHHYR
jgi:hypothetical protein